jgi:hypothetical protein
LKTIDGSGTTGLQLNRLREETMKQRMFTADNYNEATIDELKNRAVLRGIILRTIDQRRQKGKELNKKEIDRGNTCQE